ncbi:hypothetical protein Tco_0331232 [Tanacetum coccineum]
MADPDFLDHLLASPDHALVLLDHLPGVHGPKPAFPDRVLDFPDDDLAVEIEEDYGIDIDEENPEEDLDINVEDDDEVKEWEVDEDWLMAQITPPRLAKPARTDTPPLPLPSSKPASIDPMMLPRY